MLMGAGLAWDGDRWVVLVIVGWRGAYLVEGMGGRGLERQLARVGAPGAALGASAGLAAVTGVCGRQGGTGAVDAAVGLVKRRDGGWGAGGLLAGEDFLADLGR